jgi:D-alanyl-D-alanine carboxypeptidase/D-alanyl-D-alanine-endopeptidase (penicillin-binding protein 4)
VCLHVRWRSVLPLVVATAVTGAAVFVAVDRHDSSHRSATPTAHPTPVAAPARPAVLAALDSGAAMPTALTTKTALAASLAAMPAGERLEGAVVDVTSGTTLWSRDADTPQPPASTLKLLTAAAALRTFGPNYRFTTQARLVANTVYLVGGGDPTLVRTSAPRYDPAPYPLPATLSDLAEQTAAALPAGQPVHLSVDATGWEGPKLAKGWSPDYVTEGDVTPPSPLELNGGRLRASFFDSPRTSDPVGQAGKAFAALLRHDGVDVEGAVKEAPAPPAVQPLAQVSSPPLSALIQRMLTDSDNDLAEAIGHRVAVAAGFPASFSGEARALEAQATILGVAPGLVSLHDASGLSHDDAVAPAALVTVLRAAASAGGTELRPILEGLPIAGLTGTLADRYRGHGAKAGGGVVRAKTGTLTGVDCLAGLVVDANGRLLAFAFLASGSGAEDPVEQGLDRVVAGLATLT